MALEKCDQCHEPTFGNLLRLTLKAQRAPSSRADHVDLLFCLSCAKSIVQGMAAQGVTLPITEPQWRATGQIYVHDLLRPEEVRERLAAIELEKKARLEAKADPKPAA